MATAAKRLRATVIGLCALALGAFLRFAARDIAWPDSLSYSGPRENTEWAFKELAYTESGLLLVIFGLSVILVVLINWLWTPSDHRQ